MNIPDHDRFGKAVSTHAGELSIFSCLIHVICAILILVDRASPAVPPRFENHFFVDSPFWGGVHALFAVGIVVLIFFNTKTAKKIKYWWMFASAGAIGGYGFLLFMWGLQTDIPVSLLGAALLMIPGVPLSVISAFGWGERADRAGN